MLVDDDSASRRQGRAILKDLYEVYPFPSAYKMFEVLEVVMPDLILLDIQMPVIDGFETIKRLKGDDRFASIPVMFLTASNDKESVIKGSTLGAAGFITKPFSADDLFQRIESFFIAQGATAGSETPEPQEKAPEPPKGKPVILAIDDAPDILKSVHSILRDKYKVYTLPKPEKLKALLPNIKPDLFLLDYQMPGISGFDLIPLIRAFPEYEETPVILLTSEGTFEHLTVAVDLGAIDFIVKPFDADTLRDKVSKCLAGKG